MNLLVTNTSAGARLLLGGKEYAAAIGRGGIAVKNGEGDGITPVGTFPVRQVFFRADRVPTPKTKLSLTEISRDDGWCDAPGDPNYNQFVTHPYRASAERLWRDDHLYDVVVVLGYNEDPVVPGKGSAIFLHVAAPDYATTEGCVALKVEDLLAVLEKLSPGDTITIAT
jgi:L,D-peptidoglycan transpeptidase YkuD (ErfK/YbiS/YcfS/YnhG family)